MVVYTRGSGLQVPDGERVIAEIARAVYDYFVFGPTM